jgi:hypothetical protein
MNMSRYHHLTDSVPVIRYTLSSNLDRMTGEKRNEYKQFLLPGTEKYKKVNVE